MKDKKDPAVLKAGLSLSFLLFSSVVTHAFPWFIKGKAGRPRMGIGSIQASPDRIITNPSNLEPTRTQHKHTAERQPSSRHPFTLSTRDLGPIPLSPVCNPYYKLSVLVTRAAATNWT